MQFLFNERLGNEDSFRIQPPKHTHMFFIFWGGKDIYAQIMLMQSWLLLFLAPRPSLSIEFKIVIILLVLEILPTGIYIFMPYYRLKKPLQNTIIKK